MATLSKLAVGQKLYKLVSVRMGNTKVRRKSLREYTVTEVHEDRVVVRSNNNPPQPVSPHHLKSYRISKPEQTGTDIHGYPRY